MGTGLTGKGSELGREGEPTQGNSTEWASANFMYLFYHSGLSFGKPHKVWVIGVHRWDGGMEGDRRKGFSWALISQQSKVHPQELTTFAFWVVHTRAPSKESRCPRHIQREATGQQEKWGGYDFMMLIECHLQYGRMTGPKKEASEAECIWSAIQEGSEILLEYFPDGKEHTWVWWRGLSITQQS